MPHDRVESYEGFNLECIGTSVGLPLPRFDLTMRQRSGAGRPNTGAADELVRPTSQVVELLGDLWRAEQSDCVLVPARGQQLEMVSRLQTAGFTPQDGLMPDGLD